MTEESFIEEKEDGACLPCSKPKRKLLEELKNIPELNSLIDLFFQEFELRKDFLVEDDDSAIIFDKEDGKYHKIRMPLSEREQRARENLCLDYTGWFDEIITDSSFKNSLVDFFRKLAKEKFL